MWSGLPKKSGASFATQVKYPKFQPKTPEMWVNMAKDPVNSAQVPYLFKCDSVTIPPPHIR